MVWFFQRQRDWLHYEIRHDPEGLDYQLVITHPDGRQDVERFSDDRALAERSSWLQQSLISTGWQPPATRAGRGLLQSA